MGVEQGKVKANMPGSPQKAIQITRWVSDLDWRRLLLLFSSLSFFFLFSSSILHHTPSLNSIFAPRGADVSLSSNPEASPGNYYDDSAATRTRKGELTQSRIAVCLVGGARRFELTGPSIVDRILNEYPNSDLFLNSPFDSNSFKLSLLKFAPRLATVRIFRPSPIPESESMVRVLTAANSPNGIQGLLQYFNLVEGCLTMIQAYQKEKAFVYDWIIRTRVDGYWASPLDPNSFIPGQYVVPPGSTFGGLNDRFGVGDYNTSLVALSRLSLIPALDSLGYIGLNSETSFKAQLTAFNISAQARPQHFCIVTDRKYKFLPGRFDVPVAALSSIGPLSGAKCRPCRPFCVGPCVAHVMLGLQKGWSWTPWRNGTLELCDARGEWEVGWHKVFDGVAGERLAQSRRRVGSLDVEMCVEDFKEMKARAFNWDTPPLDEICKLGLDLDHSN